jgi:hypothetical protein
MSAKQPHRADERDSGLAHDPATHGGSRGNPGCNARIVGDVHECARTKHNGVSAEDVEYPLFRINGSYDEL